jgi:hypothetical protein
VRASPLLLQQNLGIKARVGALGMPDNATGRAPVPVIEDDLRTASAAGRLPARARLPSATMHPSDGEEGCERRPHRALYGDDDRSLLDRMGADSVLLCRPLAATKARSTCGLPRCPPPRFAHRPAVITVKRFRAINRRGGGRGRCVDRQQGDAISRSEAIWRLLDEVLTALARQARKKGEARMGLNRRIVVSEARCAVRINIDCDDHLRGSRNAGLKVSAVRYCETVFAYAGRTA